MLRLWYSSYVWLGWFLGVLQLLEDEDDYVKTASLLLFSVLNHKEKAEKDRGC